MILDFYGTSINISFGRLYNIYLHILYYRSPFVLVWKCFMAGTVVSVVFSFSLWFRYDFAVV